MRVERKRLIGAVVFAGLCAALFSDSLLRGEGGVDIASLVGALLATGLVGYLAWPALEHSWGQRDKRDDGKRLLMIGLGLALGFVAVKAVRAVAGDDDATWAFFLWLGTLTVVFISVIVQVRRAHRS